jgi:hypothetical protein
MDWNLWNWTKVNLSSKLTYFRYFCHRDGKLANIPGVHRSSWTLGCPSGCSPPITSLDLGSLLILVPVPSLSPRTSDWGLCYLSETILSLSPGQASTSVILSPLSCGTSHWLMEVLSLEAMSGFSGSGRPFQNWLIWTYLEKGSSQIGVR